jgi:hypothetical protein
MRRYVANFTEAERRGNLDRSGNWPIDYVVEVPATDYHDARVKLFDVLKTLPDVKHPFLRSRILYKEDYEKGKNLLDPKQLRKAGIPYG